MDTKCNIVEQNPPKYAVTFEENEVSTVIGHMFWDVACDEWVADDSLLRCLELLTSDSRLREGRLGKDLDRSRNIVMRVAYAWYTVKFHGNQKASLTIHKLDIPKSEENIVLFDYDRRLLDLI